MPITRQKPVHQSSQVYAIIAVIAIVILLIVSVLVAMHSQATSGQLTPGSLLVSHHQAASSPDSLTPSTAYTNDSPVTQEMLEHEITDLMIAFGIDDASTQSTPEPEVFAETDVEMLSAANTTQIAPSAGTYQAVNLFERGIQKNLAAIQDQGYNITITLDGAGRAQVNFFGLEFAATYDDHYLYLEDQTRVPYYYDGVTITAAAHRIELDLQKTL